MAQSRKHRSKRVAMVEGARVIKRGTGSGDFVKRKVTVAGMDTRKKHMKEQRTLISGDRVTKTDEERIAGITDRVKAGKTGLRVVRRG